MKKLFCVFLCCWVICGLFSCGYESAEQTVQALEEKYNEVVDQRDNIITSNKTEFTTLINSLTEQLDTACVGALENNDVLCEYYIKAREALQFAVSAYEEYMVCKYQSGSIGVTLIVAYEYSVQKQITLNVISLLKGYDEYYPIEQNLNIVEPSSDFYEQVLEINKKIAVCTTAVEANYILASLEDLVNMLQKKAEFSICEACLDLSDIAAESVAISFKNFLLAFDDFERKSFEALESIECSELFALRSQLYNKLEKAILLCSLID